jgi:hypothetical protein
VGLPKLVSSLRALHKNVAKIPASILLLASGLLLPMPRKIPVALTAKLTESNLVRIDGFVRRVVNPQVRLVSVVVLKLG